MKIGPFQITRWISVENKLPEVTKSGEEDIVIVTGYDNGVRYVFWASVYAYGKEDEVFSVPGWSKMNVTHWMPLPDPPKQ